MLSLITQYTDTTVEVSNGVGAFAVFLYLVFVLAFLALTLIGMWKVFEKMGEPGWKGIVPIYNIYVIFSKSRPENAVVFTILSLFCFVFGIVAMYDLAKMFGKEIFYTIGLVFFPAIFLIILGFGDAQYQGPPAQPYANV